MTLLLLLINSLNKLLHYFIEHVSDSFVWIISKATETDVRAAEIRPRSTFGGFFVQLL